MTLSFTKRPVHNAISTKSSLPYSHRTITTHQPSQLITMPRYTHPPPPPPPQKPQTRYSHPPPSTQPTRPANGPAKRYPTTETIIVDLADLARQKNALRQQSVNTVSYGRAPTAPSPPKKGGYDEWYGERRRAATMSAQALPV